jgi:hypothetical protein
MRVILVLAAVVGCSLLWYESKLVRGTADDSDFLWAVRHPFAAYDVYFDSPNPELVRTLGSEQASGIAWMLAHMQTTATLLVDPPPSLRARMAEALGPIRALLHTPPNGDDKPDPIAPRIESQPPQQTPLSTGLDPGTPSPADVNRAGVDCKALIAISTPKIGDDGLRHSTVTCLNGFSGALTLRGGSWSLDAESSKLGTAMDKQKLDALINKNVPPPAPFAPAPKQ